MAIIEVPDRIWLLSRKGVDKLRLAPSYFVASNRIKFKRPRV